MIATIDGTLNSVNPGVIAAAGNYAALDVISQSATNGAGVAWVFDRIGRKDGGGGVICGAEINFSAASMVATTRLWLFTANPSSCELDDNAAFDLVAADRGKVVGHIDFAALADHGAVSYAQNITVRLPYQCAATDDALYGILLFIDAETNEAASMTCAIKLHVDQD